MSVFLAVLCTAFITSSTQAQQFPVFEVLKDESVLAAYAAEQAAEVTAFYSTGTPKTSPVATPTADGVFQTLRSMSLPASFDSPTSQVTLTVQVRNQEGDLVLIGTNVFSLKFVDNQFVLPEDIGEVALAPSSEVPIFLSGVISAEVLPVGNDGQVVTGLNQQLRIGNDGFYFPPTLISDQAILVVQIQNEMFGTKWVYWDLQRGVFINPPKHFNLPILSTVKGIVSRKDAEVSIEIPTSNGRGENVVVEYKATGAQTLKMSFLTSEGKAPHHILLRRARDYWVAYPVVEGVGPQLEVWVEPGVYYGTGAFSGNDLKLENLKTWTPPPMMMTP